MMRIGDDTVVGRKKKSQRKHNEINQTNKPYLAAAEGGPLGIRGGLELLLVFRDDDAGLLRAGLRYNSRSRVLATTTLPPATPGIPNKCAHSSKERVR